MKHKTETEADSCETAETAAEPQRLQQVLLGSCSFSQNRPRSVLRAEAGSTSTSLTVHTVGKHTVIHHQQIGLVLLWFYLWFYLWCHLQVGGRTEPMCLEGNQLNTDVEFTSCSFRFSFWSKSISTVHRSQVLFNPNTFFQVIHHIFALILFFHGVGSRRI